VLVIWTVVAALVVRRYPGPNALDNWGFSLVGPSLHSSFSIRVTELGSIPVLAGGSILAALAVVGRDHRRAVACLIGPPLATLLAQWILKPLVARYYLQVLTFPSGTITVVASLAAAWALAVPGWLRWAVVGIGIAAVALASVAVLALRWHYPSDVLAGAAFGVGMVLVVDGVLHRLDRSEGRPASAPTW
jgi:membrane-associated phospholipid phosphatase